MEKRLRQIGSVGTLLINEGAALPRIDELLLMIRNQIKSSERPSITIDVSTFIKWHLLVLLKALDLHGILPYVRLLYTEPGEYVLDHPLSLYVKDLTPIPFFQGHFDFSRKTLLVIMLGYEGDRALALFENIDPDECLLLVPEPAYKREWEGRTQEMNAQVINLAGASKLRVLHSRDPSVVFHQLVAMLAVPELRDYNQFVAPLGTKPQVVGLFNYLCRYGEYANVVSLSPLRHNDPYSDGIGATWVIQEPGWQQEPQR
jgi:hypothetical protein